MLLVDIEKDGKAVASKTVHITINPNNAYYDWLNKSRINWPIFFVCKNYFDRRAYSIFGVHIEWFNIFISPFDCSFTRDGIEIDNSFLCSSTKEKNEPQPPQSLPFGMLWTELEKLFFVFFFFFLLDFIFVWIMNIKLHWKRKTKLFNTKWFYFNIYLYQPFVGSVDSDGFERFPIWIYETEWLLLLNFTNDFWHYKQNFRQRKYQRTFRRLQTCLFFFLYKGMLYGYMQFESHFRGQSRFIVATFDAFVFYFGG